MVDNEEKTIAQIEKLRFVELLVYFNGVINREDIINRFGISKASATNILSAYSQLAPQNLTYNVRLKRYEISQSFNSVFNGRMLIDRIPVYTMPKLYEPEDEDAIGRIAMISRAIQRTRSLSITYSSASSGTNNRDIVPVAFADNLLRWHLRAYDRRRKRFGDFVFERVQEVREISGDTIESHEHPNCDTQWHSFVELWLKGHADNLVDANSFSARGDFHSVRIRAAMAGYFLQLWNVDCSRDSSLRGKQYQYVLVNLEDVSRVADLTLAPGFGIGT